MSVPVNDTDLARFHLLAQLISRQPKNEVSIYVSHDRAGGDDYVHLEMTGRAVGPETVQRIFDRTETAQIRITLGDDSIKLDESPSEELARLEKRAEEIIDENVELQRRLETLRAEVRRQWSLDHPDSYTDQDLNDSLSDEIDDIAINNERLGRGIETLEEKIADEDPDTNEVTDEMISDAEEREAEKAKLDAE